MGFTLGFHSSSEHIFDFYTFKDWAPLLLASET